MLGFADLAIPPDWPVLVGVDTGTYMSALLVAFSPDPYAALVFAEFPNYAYVGGEIDLLGLTNSEWAQSVVTAYRYLKPGTTRVHAWCDQNTQFREEFIHYDLVLRGNPRELELRTEISRAYFQRPDTIWLAPWLSVLPYELEHAQWPPKETSAGRFVRLKHHDHTLDCLEHVLSRKPRAKALGEKPKETFLERYLREHQQPRFVHGDIHLGRHA